MRVCVSHNCALSGDCAFGKTVSVCSDSSVSGSVSWSSAGGVSGVSTGAFSSGGSSQRIEPLYMAATKKPEMAAHTKKIVTYTSASDPGGAKGGGSGDDGGSAILQPDSAAIFNAPIRVLSAHTHTRTD